MQSKPIDVGRFALSLVVAPPELRTDPTTGQPRVDREGRHQWAVSVAVRPTGGRRSDADVIEVVVPGEPSGITEGMPVELVDLWAQDWAFDGRQGTSWRAAEIRPAAPSAPARGGKGGE